MILSFIGQVYILKTWLMRATLNFGLMKSSHNFGWNKTNEKGQCGGLGLNCSSGSCASECFRRCLTPFFCIPVSLSLASISQVHIHERGGQWVYHDQPNCSYLLQYSKIFWKASVLSAPNLNIKLCKPTSKVPRSIRFDVLMATVKLKSGMRR